MTPKNEIHQRFVKQLILILDQLFLKVKEKGTLASSFY
jgi:hypothetical protein